MSKEKKLEFNAEQEIKLLMGEDETVEDQIIHLFMMLPKDRQKVILSELWSEFKPEKPQGLRNFNNLPF